MDKTYENYKWEDSQEMRPNTNNNHEEALFRLVRDKLYGLIYDND